MRKKLLAPALVFALVFTLCACGAEAQTAKEEASQVVEATATPEPSPEPTPQPEPVIDYEITYTNCKVGTDDAGRNTFAQILFVVENKGDCNITLSYEKPSYVDLVDEAGNIVETKNIGGGYPSVIKPGEKSYFFQQEVITTEERNLTAVPSIDFQQAFEEITFLPTKDVTFGRDTHPYNPSGVVASGIVENTTGKLVTYCNIYVVLFSGDDPVGVISSYISDPIHEESEAEFETIDGREMQRFVNFNDITSYEASAYIIK
jgi:hypothetical protein